MRCLRLRGVRHLLRVFRQTASQNARSICLTPKPVFLIFWLQLQTRHQEIEIISCAPYSLIKVSLGIPSPSLSSQWLTGLTILGLCLSEVLGHMVQASEATLDLSMYHNPTLGFQALLPFGLSSQHFLFTTCSGQLVMQLINTSTLYSQAQRENIRYKHSQIYYVLI